jgi:hypothetical protein
LLSQIFLPGSETFARVFQSPIIRVGCAANAIN